MINNLQVLRLFAALGVLFYHTRYGVLRGVHTDFQGVSVFFVISGFIMTMISQKSAHMFMLNRIVRIVPLYWIISFSSLLWVGFALTNPLSSVPTIIALAKSGFVPLSDWVTHYAEQMTTAEVGTSLVKSMFFIPFGENPGPILGVGWTLNLEMFYYLVFGLLLLINKRLAPLFTLAVLVGIQHLNCGGFCHLYGSDYTSFFVAGIVLFYVWRLVGSVTNHLVRYALLSISLLSVVFFIYGNLSGMVYSSKMFFFSGPIIVVSAALFLHSSNFSVQWQLPVYLGNASYSLYLIHSVLLETLINATRDVPWIDPSKSPYGVALGVVVSLIVASVVHSYVEKPITRSIRGAMDGLFRVREEFTTSLAPANSSSH